ncbi:MAG TPA: response regulator transcription factor [Puia sp.]|nr:response regulator transcription factor [Puia sp.]
MNIKKYKVALVDDHALIRSGLVNLIREFGEFEVVCEANNGKHFQQCLSRSHLPEIVLLDLNMPEMDGYMTAAWIRETYPDIKVLALSMDDKDRAIIRMLRHGARGYILKDVEPAELRRALTEVLTKGYYYSEMVTSRLIHNINQEANPATYDHSIAKLTEKELQFIKYACTEMTYKEIADAMFLSPRTIDGYRDSLFIRLDVRTRVGLAIYAIRNGIFQI